MPNCMKQRKKPMKMADGGPVSSKPMKNKKRKKYACGGAVKKTKG